MKTPIAGLCPPETREAVVLVTWPTIGSLLAGRIVGQLAGLGRGWGPAGILAKLLTLATIPVSLAAFAWLFVPGLCRRYRLTNRRVVIAAGYRGLEHRAIGLDEFDAIQVQQLAGQAWLEAGDLVFQRNGQEVFRLAGVSTPDVVREACLKARSALVATRQVIQQQREQAAQKTQPAAV